MPRAAKTGDAIPVHLYYLRTVIRILTIVRNLFGFRTCEQTDATESDPRRGATVPRSLLT
jgi:hypothetical protein